VVIKDGKLVGYNIHSIPGRGKDTLTYRHPFGSAIGISKKRQADIAWVFTDSTIKLPYAMQWTMDAIKDSVIGTPNFRLLLNFNICLKRKNEGYKREMEMKRQ
jgi:hypothetical protein